MQPNDIVFQEHPVVTIGGNHFLCPTIIQFENEPLIEVGKFEAAGFTTKFAIYNSSGDKIAVVKGCQIHSTKEGKDSGVKMRFEPGLTACEYQGRTLVELRRKGAAALKGWAELYAPEGVFIKVNDSEMAAMLGTGGSLTAGGITMMGCTIQAPIGILFKKTGGVAIGASRGGASPT